MKKTTLILTILSIMFLIFACSVPQGGSSGGGGGSTTRGGTSGGGEEEEEEDTTPAENIIYVSCNGGSDLLGDGSITAPFKTIAKAINVYDSQNITGDIYVSAGIYTTDKSIELIEGIRIKGGYSQDWSDRKYQTLEDRLNTDYETKIVFERGTSSFISKGTFNFNDSTITNNTVLEGLTIIGDDGNNSLGYGLTISNGADPIVRYCSIKGSWGAGKNCTNSAGVLISNGNITLKQCDIIACSYSSNYVTSIRITNSNNTIISGCSISALSSASDNNYSIGIYATDSKLTLDNNTISSLFSTYESTGCYFMNVELINPMHNNTIKTDGLNKTIGMEIQSVSGIIKNNILSIKAPNESIGIYFYNDPDYISESLQIEENEINTYSIDDLATGIITKYGNSDDMIIKNTIISDSENDDAIGIEIDSHTIIKINQNNITANAAETANGIKIDGISSDAHFTVDNNVIASHSKNIANGVYLRSCKIDCTFLNNEISADTTSGNTDIYDINGNAYGFYVEQNSTVKIENNTISNLKGKRCYGLYLNNSTGIIKNNTINGGVGVLSSTGLSGGDHDSIIENNIINGGESVKTVALYLSNTSNGIIIRNNTLYGGNGAEESKALVTYSNSSIINNILFGGSAPITYGIYTNIGSLGTDISPYIYNNTIDGGSGTTSYAVYSDGSFKLYNNIFTGSGDTNCGIYEYSSYPRMSMYNNCFDSNKIDTLFHHRNSNVGVINNIDDINNIEDNNHFSISANNINLNPEFEDQNNYDYHLTGDTPEVILTGAENLSSSLPVGFPVNSVNEPVDKDAVPKGSEWSYGAYEL